MFFLMFELLFSRIPLCLDVNEFDRFKNNVNFITLSQYLKWNGVKL